MRQQQPARTVNHIVGLDLGQTTDFTALAVLEQARVGTDPAVYDVRELRRWHLGTAYTRIVEDVLELLARPELIAPTLVLDASGVGRAVSDMLRHRVQCHFVPMTITSGMTANRAENGDWRVPKVDIVGVLQALLGQRRLNIVRTLREANLLAKELRNFQTKILPSAYETFAAREGEHDDMCLAVGCAAWVGENLHTGQWTFEPDSAGRSAFAGELSRLQREGFLNEHGGIHWPGADGADPDDDLSPEDIADGFGGRW